MTEAEWAADDDPKSMFAVVENRLSQRQARLFACACGLRYCRIWESSAAVDEHYRRVKPVVDASCEAVIRAAQDLPDGAVSRATTDELLARLGDGVPIGLRHDVLQTVRGRADWWIGGLADVPRTAHGQGLLLPAELRERQENARFCSALLRDIFGNPFRPVTFAPFWRTDTATALATGMYDSRDFGAMPILADALQDAGCDNDGVLSHCRDTNATHVRGCWVVDLVLGKE